MRRINAALALLTLLYLCGGTARAQSTTGTIRDTSPTPRACASRRDGQRHVAQPAGHAHAPSPRRTATTC